MIFQLIPISLQMININLMEDLHIWMFLELFQDIFKGMLVHIHQLLFRVVGSDC